MDKLEQCSKNEFMELFEKTIIFQNISFSKIYEETIWNFESQLHYAISRDEISLKDIEKAIEATEKVIKKITEKNKEAEELKKISDIENTICWAKGLIIKIENQIKEWESLSLEKLYKFTFLNLSAEKKFISKIAKERLILLKTKETGEKSNPPRN